MKTENIASHLQNVIAVESVDEITAYSEHFFIRCAYLSVLGREPDEDGLENYLKKLRDGIGKKDIVAELSLSKEGRTQKANISGLDSATAEYKKKHSRSLIAIFFGHKERANLANALTSRADTLSKDFATFVQQTYREILGRDADSEGAKYYVARLQSGVTQAQIRIELSSSEEAQTRLESLRCIEMQNEENMLFIQKAYQELLGRNPDDEGRASYVTRLNAGESKTRILDEICISKEARERQVELREVEEYRFRERKFSLVPIALSVSEILSFEDDSFIHCLYKTILERMPTLEEELSVFAEMRSGSKKLDVVAKLRGSREGMRIRSYLEGVDDLMASHKAQLKVPAPIQQNFSKEKNSLWFDMSQSMDWTGGVVGIIRAELTLATELKKIHPSIRFSVCIGNGIMEISAQQLNWLFTADNVVDAYMRRFDRYPRADGTAGDNSSAISKLILGTPSSPQLQFPFKSGDAVISVGWMDSEKEKCFSKIKAILPNFYVIYLIYDVILARPETSIFYAASVKEKFERYVNWVSNNCDMILYGGDTAKVDTRALQKKMNWQSPHGVSAQFGTDIMKSAPSEDDSIILAQMGVCHPFVITVGSIEPRKNHDTLRRAFLMALEMDAVNTPQLVICGHPNGQINDVVDSLDRNPMLRGTVLRLRPTDPQLAALYRNCGFTLLASVYEGWSLTLPESLGIGKFCLAADTPPLREIGRDMIDYVSPWDVKSWAEKILLYSTDKKRLANFEAKISRDWKHTSWADTAASIDSSVMTFLTTNPSRKSTPEIWFDLTVSFMLWDGGLAGTIRTELTFARYLNKMLPNVHFFALSGEVIFEIKHDLLLWLFGDEDLSSAYKSFQDFWKPLENAGTAYRNPFTATGGPYAEHPSAMHEFPAGSVVYFAGIDFNLVRCKKAVEMRKKSDDILISQLIYDFTPMLFPHLHAKMTCDVYPPFIKYVSNHFDHIIYGGKTAERDGKLIQRQNGWRIPPSDAIQFGSDIDMQPQVRLENLDNERDRLAKMGVAEKFVMTVGTIEPRKNHEMLYKAFLTLLDRGDIANIPQILFVGRKGWNVNDFLAIFEADARTRGHILVISPSDEELDIMYRHCMFTLLPSQYEGWSLTLPESLGYGKFCLTSDVEPLRETGGNFVEYIHPLDTVGWANRILYYATHPDALREKEAFIKNNWKAVTWQQSTKTVIDILHSAHKKLIDGDLLLPTKTAEFTKNG
jgi:glycosyltransferase involved in cell wall biosynthesis